MKVIINADDLGISDKVNKSVIKMHQKGIVSSTTIMANGPDFEGATNLVKDHPELGIGVHLCLDGNFHSSTDYATLLDPASNTFFEQQEVIKRIRKSSFDKDEIYKEFSLQVEKVLDHGVSVSHLDTHHHLHLYFPVLSQVIRVARKFGVPFIRSQRINTCVPRSKINKAYRYAHHLYLNAQVKSIPGYYDPDIQNCGDFDHNLNRLEGMFNKTKGIIEIMLHPAGDDDPETNFFSSPEVEHLLSRHSIVNYNHLR